ncbi:MAG: hypothetical protein RIC19_02960 [Phaeodactylibacter sp.]|uniref:hypothetical protein n=1 Tax=Phaeodactylibacter sp. TaxID=1940289 RepID=UPI0032EC4811
MSLKDDLKKLLFGAKSAARSVGRKAEEQGTKLGEELSEQSKDYYQKAKRRMEELDDEYRPKVKKKAQEARGFAEELVNEAFKSAETPETEPEVTHTNTTMDDNKKNEKLQEDEPSFEDIFSGKTTPPEKEPQSKEKDPGQRSKVDEFGEEFSRVAGEAGRKAADLSERVGKRVLDTSDKVNERLFEEGEKLWDKAKEKGSTFMDRFEGLVDKANEEAKKESMDDLTEQAKKMDEELERRVKERGQRSNAENLERDRKKEPLGGMDSFFDKAERYVSGDYADEGQSDKDLTIRKDPDYKPKKNTGKVKGFDDLDGDGDEIIDDAILDDGDDK